MKSTPLVSIITVNYNQTNATYEFLESLHNLNYSNYEVIVVDNASSQTSVGLKKTFPFITHITSPHNIGFAGGNNLGLLYAKGEYAFFINNDTIVTNDLLNVLVKHLQDNIKCGIVCPKIKYYSQPDTIQYAGAIGLHPITCRSHDIGYLQKDDGSYDVTRKTDLPNGAAMLIPMNLIRKIGTMSEIFFLYYEELDWAAKFKKAGYEIHYVGGASILHKESLSTGKYSPFKTYYLHRNRLLYIRRNHLGLKKIAGCTFFSIISTPFHLAKYLIKGEWSHISATVKALFWHLNHNPNREPLINSESLKQRLLII